METNKSEFERYEAAQKKVKKLKDFYSHLLTYVIVVSFLAFINFYYTPQYLWFIWTLMGWGIGVLFHALGTFEIIPFFGKDWEQKKINELIEKENHNQKKWE
ncbi:2TM domain-containing protein [Flavobacterium nitratireducens]|uniref:2TM domain-containing protein n=1 Tax=Flavobacterium nitratireducens TaxID=992289 RepID=UPI002414EF08|nr:2TM domain-containing protein [Flavobacterium nitratireducens]